MPISPATLNQQKLLGRDGALDNDGNFMVAQINGFKDIATVGGPANLKQALLSRCAATPKKIGSRLAGSVPAHPNYGVGAPLLVSAPMDEASQQLKTVLVSNLNAEPRIEKIKDSDITITEDLNARTLTVSVIYTPIGTEVPENLIFPIYIS